MNLERIESKISKSTEKHEQYLRRIQSEAKVKNDHARSVYN